MIATKNQLKQIIEEELQNLLKEKAKSKSQQRFMGMVRKCQETGDCASEEVRKAAKSMKKKDASDFAKTKHKGLPEKKKKKINEAWGAPDPTEEDLNYLASLTGDETSEEIAAKQGLAKAGLNSMEINREIEKQRAEIVPDAVAIDQLGLDKPILVPKKEKPVGELTLQTSPFQGQSPEELYDVGYHSAAADRAYQQEYNRIMRQGLSENVKKPKRKKK